jgi:hypothetical protein
LPTLFSTAATRANMKTPVLSELAPETFFPANDLTAELMRTMAANLE